MRQLRVQLWKAGMHVAPWDEQPIGFLEIDLVAHCSMNSRGQYLFNLVATDVASGWTECMGMPSKCQDDVFSALELFVVGCPLSCSGWSPITAASS